MFTITLVLVMFLFVFAIALVLVLLVSVFTIMLVLVVFMFVFTIALVLVLLLFVFTIALVLVLFVVHACHCVGPSPLPICDCLGPILFLTMMLFENALVLRFKAVDKLSIQLEEVTHPNELKLEVDCSDFALIFGVIASTALARNSTTKDAIKPWDVLVT
jgi:hypothetical protein